MPVFPIRLILLAIPVLLVGALLAAAVGRGLGMLKKQGVAWGLTVLMIFAAIGIGYAKAPVAGIPVYPSATVPDHPSETVPPAAANSFVWDDANVLSSDTVRQLDARNDKLWERYGVTVGVVTCNYGGNDPYSYATGLFDDMGLGSDDMLVGLDISGDDYWMLTGDRVARQFSDEDCSDYTYGYMEDNFARGDYDDAVLALTEALEAWYQNNYN